MESAIAETVGATILVDAGGASTTSTVSLLSDEAAGGGTSAVSSLDEAAMAERWFLKKLPSVLISYINDYVDIDTRVRSIFLAKYPNSGPRPNNPGNPRFLKLRGLSLGEEESEECGAHNLTCVERTLPIANNPEKSINIWVEIWSDAAPFRRDRSGSEMSAASESSASSEVLMGYHLLSDRCTEPLDEFYYCI